MECISGDQWSALVEISGVHWWRSVERISGDQWSALVEISGVH